MGDEFHSKRHGWPRLEGTPEAPVEGAPPAPEFREYAPIPATGSIADLALDAIQQRTAARIFQGRVGVGYRTVTQLELRRDHAAALDAVHAEVDLDRDLGPEFIARWKLFEVQTQAGSKVQYLMRPDLGRRLSQEALEPLTQHCNRGADLQIVIGDGLSAAAVIEQVPHLLPLLADGAEARGLGMGQSFFIRHCRVGVMNDIGELLDPRLVILLIGERPGLATAQSLSAYFAYCPRLGHTDAQRNLISNIHDQGLPPNLAAERILDLAQLILRSETSGVTIKEILTKIIGLSNAD